MKLKKIASLALAGVMAVSMLAGCSTTSDEPTPDEPTAVAGDLTDSVIASLTDNAKDGLDLTAGNTSSLSTQLTAFVKKFGNDQETGRRLNTYTIQNDDALQGDFATFVDADKTAINDMMTGEALNDTVVAVKLYAFNASVDDEQIADLVAARIDDAVEGLPRETSIDGIGEDDDNTNLTGGIEFDYTISVAYVEDSITVDYIASNDGAVKYVAVMITGMGHTV